MPHKDLQARKEYEKKHREENKDKIKAQQKEWREANKDKIKEYHKEYRKTEQWEKQNRMCKWRCRGVKNVNDELYDYFINCDNCEACGCEFIENNKKCLDHDHDTGDFRFVLCNKCNVRDNWKNKI